MTGRDRAELARAHATLQRGADFLAQGLSREGARPAITGRYRARVLGNGLRELDRFLSLLIDALAGACGIALPAGERETANKLASLRAMTGAPHDDHARLTALARSRDCLFHCEGLVRRGDRRGDASMTVGWPMREGAVLPRVAIGERLSLSGAELDEICGYYRAIAAQLFSESGLPVPPAIPGTPPSPGSACAIAARSASSGR